VKPMTTEVERRYSVEEYLARERSAETKSEFLQGEIVAMSGASRPHNLLVVNLIASIQRQLRGKPCEVYPSDMRVQVPAADFFTYPDLAVVCEEPRLADEFLDTLLNPTLLIEVLSRSTADYDRGRKFEYYRHLDSLREYVLIAQDRVHVEHHTRQPDGSWRLDETDDPEALLDLPSIGCTLPLAEVYEKVPLGSA
jgi:Uma2 family endonuclease